MEVLRLFLGVLNTVGAFVNQRMLQRLDEGPFFDGLVWGWLSLGFILVSSQAIAYFWGLILKFFSATKAPGSSPGPKPVDLSMGCGQGVIGLLLIGGFALMLLVSLFFPG